MSTTNASIATGLAGSTTGGTTAAKTGGTIGREPAVSIGALAALTNAVLVVLFAFVADFSSEQRGAILAFGTAIVPLLGAIVTRTQVTPVTKVETKLETAHAAGKAGETLQVEP